MPLFIDRLPLRKTWVDYAGSRVATWYPLLPIILTEAEATRPPLGQWTSHYRRKLSRAARSVPGLLRNGMPGYNGAELEDYDFDAFRKQRECDLDYARAGPFPN